MPFEDYISQHPKHIEYLNHLRDNKTLLADGFVKWNDDCAGCFGGPWEGNYVFARIYDARMYGGSFRLATTAEIREDYIKYDYPVDYPIDVPTVEKPFGLHLGGNDDTSYSKFGSTFEEVEGFLKNIISNPDFGYMQDSGFVFTN